MGERIDFSKPSRSRLEKEYLFMGVVSTFLRAIRAGAINVRHGAVLLAHYGRLGWTFDECSKVMVDVLREEGMYNQNPDILVSVISQAISEVYCQAHRRILLCSHIHIHRPSHLFSTTSLLTRPTLWRWRNSSRRLSRSAAPSCPSSVASTASTLCRSTPLCSPGSANALPRTRRTRTSGRAKPLFSSSGH